MAAAQVWATEHSNLGQQMECGQDYQLHMSCYQGKSCQEAGLDLVMIWVENIPFLKEEERSLKRQQES